MIMIRWSSMPSVCLLLLMTQFAFAQDDTKTLEKPKAITPEVQTAEWAVKWWMPRHKEKLEEKSKMERVDLLMIGDSITHGWENGGKPVWEEYYAKRHALNIGFSGDRTEQVIWRLQNGAVDDISPKAAVIMIGTNNTGHRMDAPEDIAEGVKAIIEELRKRIPKTKILLLSIFPRGATNDDKMRLNNVAANKLISEFADDEHVFYLDISDKFLEPDGTLPKSIMPDLLHPNGDGYAIWAKAMEPKLKELLGE
jgi:beta-glucosidase